MNIKSRDISTHGSWLAEEVVKAKLESKSNLAIEDIQNVQYPNVLLSENGLSFLNALILGAICEYHNQLREKLLESLIDIGEIDYESSDLRQTFEIAKSHDFSQFEK